MLLSEIWPYTSTAKMHFVPLVSLLAIRLALCGEVYVSDGARGFYSSASALMLPSVLRDRRHSSSVPAPTPAPAPSPAIPPDPVGDYDFPDPSVTQYEGMYHAGVSG